MMQESNNRRTFLLLTVFGTTVFLAANMIGLKSYRQYVAQQNLVLTQLRSEVAQNRLLMDQRDVWMERAHQMDAHAIPRLESAHAGAQFLESLRNSAATKGVTIQEQGFGEPGKVNDLETVSVRFKASGSMEAVARWLFDIQKEGAYRAVTELALKSDKEPPQVLCSLQITQTFLPQTSTP